MLARHRRTDAEWREKYRRFDEQMALARERGLIPPLPEQETKPEDGES